MGLQVDGNPSAGWTGGRQALEQKQVQTVQGYRVRLCGRSIDGVARPLTRLMLQTD